MGMSTLIATTASLATASIVGGWASRPAVHSNWT
jgi:hypothetical protein